MSELQIKSFCLGELQTNCYIAWCPITQHAIVIDPADSGDLISEFILHNDLNLTAIVLTHGHFDHCLGLLELSLNFAVPIFMHPKDMFLIKQAQKSAQHWLKHSVDPVPLPTAELADGQKITVGDQTLQVIITPGHTPGSVCLISHNIDQIFVDESQVYPGTQVIFTGDTLFADSYPRTDFKYSSVLELRDSWNKLEALPKETTILPGHGRSVVLEETAIFLQES